MDTILTQLQSMTAGGEAQHALFLLITGATAFLFALGISFLVLAALDPMRRRLSEIAVGSQPNSQFAARLLDILEPVNRFLRGEFRLRCHPGGPRVLARRGGAADQAAADPDGMRSMSAPSARSFCSMRW